MPLQRFDLNGSDWAYANGDASITGRATVPGCIHTDLLAEGRIADPFDRDNERHLHWIGENSWTFERIFEIDADSAKGPLFLVCEGLDTLAAVEVNGTLVGQANNMFVPHRFPVTDAVRAGENSIRVHFAETFSKIREMAERRELAASGDGTFRLWGGHYIRKNQSNYGWDWGPVCVTAGIWRDIYIEQPHAARLADLAVRQPEVSPDRAVVRIEADCERFEPAVDCRIIARLSRNGSEVARADRPLEGSAAALDLFVDQPELWWTNDLGPQPLYHLEVQIEAAKGGVLDRRTQRIGLRRLELVREKDAYGESFAFQINGRRIFARGSNWIPADVFPSRLRRADYERLVGDAAATHQNMLRVWGGGIYERPEFYEACDAHGILVWQDFMFACAAYPADDPEWRASTEAEIVAAVRRLRNHTCLALWCGNNELEMMAKKMIATDAPPEVRGEGMGEDLYREFFHARLPALVRENDPETAYWPSSHHNPRAAQWEASEHAGDRHFWGVWWGLLPFESYREVRTRFCSEFGFQSFPHPRTLDACTRPEDRNLTSYVMDHHQRGNTRAGSGNAAMLAYAGSLFRIPDGFENQVMISQITQAHAIRLAVGHWRSDQPRCAGALYWQLNDCWPGQSWSSIDYAGRWKALHYEARRFFNPTLVSIREDRAAHSAEVWVVNESARDHRLSCHVRATDCAGTELQTWTEQAEVPAGGNRTVLELDLAELVTRQSGRDFLLWAEWRDAEGRTLSRDLGWFAPPKHWQLVDPQLRVETRPVGETVECRITATGAPAFWVHPDPAFDAVADDAFFHLERGESRELHLSPFNPENPLRPDRLSAGFQSLFDLVPRPA